MILLGYGVISVSDSTLELLAGFSDFSHCLHPLIHLPERAHLYGEQRHLQVRWENETDAWFAGIKFSIWSLMLVSVPLRGGGSSLREMFGSVDPVQREHNWPVHVWVCVCVCVCVCFSFCINHVRWHFKPTGESELSWKKEDKVEAMSYITNKIHQVRTGERYICSSGSSKCYS